MTTTTATPYPSHLLYASTKMALKIHSPLVQRLKQGSFQYVRAHSWNASAKPSVVFQNPGPKISCGMSMTAGQSGDPEKINLNHLMDKTRKLWENSPQPVKSFPWNRALENFIQLILDLILAVVKYLCVPLLAVSSLSEMSYCAHQKKLFFVPFPLLIGFVVAGVLSETALELSPLLKDAEVPWHLIAIAIVFTLLKLPGPYYPYWGRILIPHLANGALLRSLWFVFFWYRRPRNVSGPTLHRSSADGSHSEPKKL
ncbi:hypothetical protein CFOL_v3_05857 [Cephalotus follicularis]|uniref:Uncharacterized protein n=1 Tax=Cephalotus follicularis TaxID=3775 RepID=A0A1Q3B3D6_CEPFO|nr:hypothetical protein CFOL_v3_05857 [Cephalotus follicularis]